MTGSETAATELPENNIKPDVEIHFSVRSKLSSSMLCADVFGNTVKIM